MSGAMRGVVPTAPRAKLTHLLPARGYLAAASERELAR
jgi:hypothetical protein